MNIEQLKISFIDVLSDHFLWSEYAYYTNSYSYIFKVSCHVGHKYLFQFSIIFDNFYVNFGFKISPLTSGNREYVLNYYGAMGILKKISREIFRTIPGYVLCLQTHPQFSKGQDRPLPSKHNRPTDMAVM